MYCLFFVYLSFKDENFKLKLLLTDHILKEDKSALEQSHILRKQKVIIAYIRTWEKRLLIEDSPFQDVVNFVCFHWYPNIFFIFVFLQCTRKNASISSFPTEHIVDSKDFRNKIESLLEAGHHSWSPKSNFTRHCLLMGITVQ